MDSAERTECVPEGEGALGAGLEPGVGVGLG